MTNDEFNSDDAKKFLVEREEFLKNKREKTRQELLEKVILLLKQEFENSSVEIYLVGSILRPFSFSSDSDVDIVVKNYKEDRFDLWTKLERLIERKVEIILFETCPFQEFVIKEGLRVV